MRETELQFGNPEHSFDVLAESSSEFKAIRREKKNV